MAAVTITTGIGNGVPAFPPRRGPRPARSHPARPPARPPTYLAPALRRRRARRWGSCSWRRRRVRRSGAHPSQPPSAARPSRPASRVADRLHVRCVVAPGDSLWSIAQRARHRVRTRAPSSTSWPRRGTARRSCRARRSCGRADGGARRGPRTTRRDFATTASSVHVVRCPYCRVDRRQGRRLAPGRRRRRGAAAARVPRLRPPVHDLRARRRGSAPRAQAVRAHRAVRPRQARVRASSGRSRRARSTAARSTTLAAEIEEEARAAGPRSRASGSGCAVLERLRVLDPVSYLRFASVYKGFEELADFEREVVELQKTTAPKPPSRPWFVNQRTSANLREPPETAPLSVDTHVIPVL